MEFTRMLFVFGVGALVGLDGRSEGAIPSYWKKPCGNADVDPRTTICCNGLAYARSGKYPACCGSIGYDAENYICCEKSIVRKSLRVLNPACCGKNVFDKAHETCTIEGYIENKTELGSECCLTENGWQCCEKKEGCCSRSGTRGGYISIPGFKPACCGYRSTTLTAECCAKYAEVTGAVPTCCAADNVRPICCAKADGSWQCCAATYGYCCGIEAYKNRLIPTEPPVNRRADLERQENPPLYAQPPYNSRDPRPAHLPPFDSRHPRPAIAPAPQLEQDHTTRTAYELYPGETRRHHGHTATDRQHHTQPPVHRVTERTTTTRFTDRPTSHTTHRVTERPTPTPPPYRPTDRVTYPPRTLPPTYTPRTLPPTYTPRTTIPPPLDCCNSRNPQSYCCPSLFDIPVCCSRHSGYRPRCCDDLAHVISPTCCSEGERPSNVELQGQDGYSGDYPYGPGRDVVNPSQPKPPVIRETYSCCRALSLEQCCREGILQYGRTFECCQDIPGGHRGDVSQGLEQGHVVRQSTTPPSHRPERPDYQEQPYHPGVSTTRSPFIPGRYPDVVYPLPGADRVPAVPGYGDQTGGKPGYDLGNAEKPPFYNYNGPPHEGVVTPPVDYYDFYDVEDNEDKYPDYRPPYYYQKEFDVAGFSAKENGRYNVTSEWETRNGSRPWEARRHRRPHRQRLPPNIRPSVGSESKQNDSDKLVPTHFPRVPTPLPTTTTTIVRDELGLNDPNIPRDDNVDSSYIYESYNWDGFNSDLSGPLSVTVPPADVDYPLGEDRRAGGNNGDVVYRSPEYEYRPPDFTNDYEFEPEMCSDEVYDMSVYICCGEVKRYRIGRLPMCCGTEAYDGAEYKCCDGNIQRSCDPSYKTVKTAWGKFI